MAAVISSVTRVPDRSLRLGFIALTDAAPLIVAQEHGWFAKHGLKVSLRREVGWATIRDKVIYGELDGAHALAPMLWAAQLGLGCRPTEVCTGILLDLHGNAITLSTRLWKQGVRDEAGLREEALRRRGENKLTFGIVFPHSMQHVLLRQWLRQVRLDPDHDVRIAVVPPAQMFRNLVAGTLDGYCVADPYNTLAVHEGHGWSPTWSARMAPGHVDKVFMVRTAFATQRPQEHAALIAALAGAAAWCDQPAHRLELARILAAPAYLDVPAGSIAPTLMGQFKPRPDVTETVPDFFIFHRGDANAPTLARATGVQNDLVASGALDLRDLSPRLPRQLFREDLYREATATLSSSHATTPSS